MLSSNRADLFWLRMAEIYGQLWINSFGIEPNRIWLESLHSLSDQQIKHGLTRLVEIGDQYPPTLTKFIALCSEKPKNNPKPKALPRIIKRGAEWLAHKQAISATRLNAMKTIQGVLK